jgi:hypothetical protein
MPVIPSTVVSTGCESASPASAGGCYIGYSGMGVITPEHSKVMSSLQSTSSSTAEPTGFGGRGRQRWVHTGAIILSFGGEHGSSEAAWQGVSLHDHWREQFSSVSISAVIGLGAD